MRGGKRVRGSLLRAGLPEDALCDCARVTMTGQSAVLVEGQHGVIELSAERIRLQTGQGVLTVWGHALALRELSLDAALVCGDVLGAGYAGAQGGGARVSDA